MWVHLLILGFLLLAWCFSIYCFDINIKPENPLFSISLNLNPQEGAQSKLQTQKLIVNKKFIKS